MLVKPLNAEAEIAALTEHHTVSHDVFVIDNYGPFRQQCAEAAASRLNEAGLIILDNSDQCLRATEVLRRHGYTQVDFSGFIPGAGYAHTTSLFFKNGMKFQTLKKDQPTRSVAQPNPPWENC